MMLPETVKPETVMSTPFLEVEVRHEIKGERQKTASLVLSDLLLTVKAGEFVSIVGPSGCGKSTLLSLIAGLARPSRGTIKIGGEPVTGVRPDVGFIFQQDALLPWRTAAENVQLALKVRGVARAERRKRAAEWMDRFGLETMHERYPREMSGGQRTRAAIAATLVYEPQLLLMDEPFSALDVQTRAIMSTELLQLWDQTRPAVVFVTHDLEEAIALADKVVVMTAGPGGTVKAEFPIDLPRPRVVQEIRFDPRFVRLYEQIWEALRAEVEEAYARTTRAVAVAS